MASVLTDELRELLLPYSRTGVREWRSASADLHRDANYALAGRIANEEAAALHMLSTIGRSGPANVIPMPRTHKYFDQAFFSVLATDDTGSVTFEVVVIMGPDRVLAYRFEQADSTGNHTYDHVQMSRKILGRNLPVKGVPCWIPTSYPAHPLPSNDPISLFFCMLTSMHGYREGSEEVIRKVLEEANRSVRVGHYLRRLNALLCGTS